MSRADDRIPVPTNGHARPQDDDTPPPMGPRPPSTPITTGPAPTIAFTPGQLAMGFGILVSLVLLALGRRRRRQRQRS